MKLCCSKSLEIKCVSLHSVKIESESNKSRFNKAGCASFLLVELSSRASYPYKAYNSFDNCSCCLKSRLVDLYAAVFPRKLYDTFYEPALNSAIASSLCLILASKP